jgi:hypothetical protein
LRESVALRAAAEVEAQTMIGSRSPSKGDFMNRARHELWKLTLLVGIVVVSFASTAQAQTINELSYTGYSWTNQSLGGTQATQFFSIASFVTTPNNQAHVYYSGADGHVHQRYQGGGQGAWIDEDLTVETHSPALSSLSRVSGFSQQNFQYVFYADFNNHVHQLLYNNYVWSDQDITASGRGVVSNGLFAMATTPNNQIHVYYTGLTDGDLHQLFFNGTGWSDTDLTIAAGGGGVASIGATITGVTIGNYQYVFYETDQESSTGPYIHEMYYNNARWTDVNLTKAVGVPLGGFNALTALVVPGTQTIKVYCKTPGGGGDLMELTTSNNATWSALDISRAGSGPQVTDQQFAAFATTPNNQLHVYYSVASPGDKSDVHQLFFNGSRWADEDLSAETHSLGAYYGPMAGFAIGNSQYVFYGQ